MRTGEWIETLKVFHLIFTTEGGKEKKHVERHGLGGGGPGGGWARPAGGSVQYSLLQRPELAVNCCFWSSQQHEHCKHFTTEHLYQQQSSDWQRSSDIGSDVKSRLRR